MNKKSMTDNYNPQGSGSNSTDNKKDGAIDRAQKARANKVDENILRNLKKSGAKMPSQHKNKAKAQDTSNRATKKAKAKKRIGTVGGYKYLTRKRNVQ